MKNTTEFLDLLKSRYNKVGFVTFVIKLILFLVSAVILHRYIINIVPDYFKVIVILIKDFPLLSLFFFLTLLLIHNYKKIFYFKSLPFSKVQIIITSIIIYSLIKLNIFLKISGELYLFEYQVSVLEKLVHFLILLSLWFIFFPIKEIKKNHILNQNDVILFCTSYIFIIIINIMWRKVGSVSLFIAQHTLHLFNNNFKILFDEKLTITYENIVLQIGSPCSGSVGIGLFISLIFFFLYFESDKIDKKEFTKYALLGIIGMYLVTVLRLILLSFFTLKYQQEEIIQMFHSNLGFFLYTIYSILYLGFMYPRVMKNRKNKNKLKK